MIDPDLVICIREDKLHRVIRVNGQHKVPARCVDDGRIAPVVIHAVRVADPAVFVRNHGTLRHARFDQHADFIGCQVGDNLFADILIDLIRESGHQGSAAILCALINTLQQHSHVRGGGLVVYIRVCIHVGALVCRRAEPLQQRRAQPEESRDECIFKSKLLHILGDDQWPSVRVELRHQRVCGRVGRLMDHVHDDGAGGIVHWAFPVLYEIGNQHWDLDRACCRECDVRRQGQALALVERKVDFLPVLQIQHIKPQRSIEACAGYDPFDLGFQILNSWTSHRRLCER